MAETIDRDERERRLSQAYNVASQTLRERHRDEFNALYAEAARERGVEWSPRLSAEEKAERELMTIFESFPELAARYQEVQPDAVPPAEG